MNGNDFVAFCLRTPLYLLLGDTLLITVTGRRTGRRYTTPVNFVRGNGFIWILTTRKRTWWRNARSATVRLRLRGREFEAHAEAVLDEPAVARQLQEYLRAHPAAARALGVRKHGDQLNQADVARLAHERLFVRLDPLDEE
jgi:deazaflavin-dependent oxidoreductase (nitroreductase family)